MALPPVEKKKVPPKPQLVQAQKTKKKNAPDAPQPKWLFPPDEENPVLNPTAKTPEEGKQENDEREKALKYLKRRVHAAPDRPAPPSELLTLVGIFLTDFGFNSTSRLFTNERKARRELNGWEDAVGQKIEKGTPTLEKIYREWYVEWKAKKLDETSSSDSSSDVSDSDGEACVATQTNGVHSSDEDSEASSDGLGGSDVEMDVPQAKGKKVKAAKVSSISSSISSTSDSDADDEGEKKKSKAKTTTASNTKAKAKKAAVETKVAPPKPMVGAMINKLKRKAASSEEDSDSDSSDSSVYEKPAKKTKTETTTTTAVASLPNGASDSPSDSEDSEDSGAESKPAATTIKAEASSESSSSESSDFDSSSEEETKRTKLIKAVPSIPKASSDSSATINDDVQKAALSASVSDSSSSATSASDSDEKPAEKLPVKKEKKKHTGAKPTPLAELSAKGVHGEISNQYQSYEYADKAYKDLSVTRGKGFTKEKNKKKRGSYRGGAIDTSGGKGFKFED
jgi:SRP40, C-terminal domain